MTEQNIKEADRIEITSIIDNYTDWLKIESNETVKRAMVPPGSTLLAEHGLSLLIKIVDGEEEHTVIMDAGVTPLALLKNIDVLGINLNEVEAIVLSHGHVDHFGGLTALIEKLPSGIDLYLHPEAFSERRMNIKPMGVITDLPRLDETELISAGANIHKLDQSTGIISDMIVTSGETERKNDFETGFTWPEVKRNGEWITDPFSDDLSIAISVKEKGLVVLGGCSHKGIINIIDREKEVTDIEKVHAVIGGFHLTGPQFEPIISKTVEEMKKRGPDYIVPMHCTGWEAMTAFQKEMPEQFLLNTVGTTFVFD
jgi:7,8-dihydropterin-6-yl-methyl-4-(beta-D-ribofuranosyl)aminobenzene 5'-phosphate synthase